MPASLAIGPYRLELAKPRLYKGAEPVPLQPRPLAVLCYLAARPGVVVGREELIANLWSGTVVTKAVLKVAVRAIREALEDDADAPRYIETVGREGYRLIATPKVLAPRADAVAEPAPPPTTGVVGRDAELAALAGAFALAADASRQVVFVSGEAGVGKTTLVDRFVQEVAGAGTARIARGQCLEQYGEAEAYLPVLEALGGLAQADGSAEVAGLLRRHAPTWAAHLPVLDATDDPPARARATGSAMPARMLREMADALEALTRERALVLVLEDLHWSDRSTVDLLGCVARRRQPARLLVIGTLRPAQATYHDHPLLGVKHELLASGRCRELSLRCLTPADVASYLGLRLAAPLGDELARLATRIHERTEGNALFVVNVVSDLIARRVLVHGDRGWRVEGSLEHATDHVPSDLQQIIHRRMHRLEPAARRTLEAASVAGDEFSVAAVAGALDEDPRTVEQILETLAAQSVLVAEAGIAEWPDGTVTGRYRFLHALYRRVLYDSIAGSRRVRLHRAIGLREEAGFAGASEQASALAMHFARGRDHARALAYHELAAAAALERHAPQEAVANLNAARAALAHLQEGPDRARRELGLVVAIATLLMAVKGYAAPETERAFARARALCDAARPSPTSYPVLRGLVSYHHVRAELADARELGDQLLACAARDPGDAVLGVQAHYGHGATLFHLGAFDAAREHFERALAGYDPAQHREHVRAYGGYDPGVACSLWLAWTLALLGRLEEAATRSRAGLALANKVGDPFSLAWAHYAAGVSEQFFGDWAASEAASAEAVRLAQDGEFPHVLGMATVNRGWALLMRGAADVGVPILRGGVAAVLATGARLVRPTYRAMLAAAAAREGQLEAAARLFDEALAEVERTGERLHEAPLLIAKSRMLAAGLGAADFTRGAADAAEACLRRALEVARAQGARLLELRAAVALARHDDQHRRAGDARAILERAYAPFAGVPAGAPEIAAARRLLADVGVRANGRSTHAPRARASRRSIQV